MKHQELISFLEIISQGSFQKAAQSLNYAQSTITAQIKNLEYRLGKELFIRDRRKISLTDAGRRLHNYARHIIDLTVEAEEAVRNTPDLTGSLSIGAAETITTYRLPLLLKKIQDQAPLIQISFKTMSDKAILDSVRAGTLDIGFLIEPELDLPFAHIHRICDEPISLYATTDHELANRPLTEDSFQDHRFLWWQEKWSYRLLFETHMKSRGIPLLKTMEFANIETLKQCTIAGIGIGLLCDIAVEREVADGRLVRLDYDLNISMSSYFFWNKHRENIKALNYFVETSQRYFSGQGDQHSDSETSLTT